MLAAAGPAGPCGPSSGHPPRAGAARGPLRQEGSAAQAAWVTQSEEQKVLQTTEPRAMEYWQVKFNVMMMRAMALAGVKGLRKAREQPKRPSANCPFRRVSMGRWPSHGVRLMRPHHKSQGTTHGIECSSAPSRRPPRWGGRSRKRQPWHEERANRRKPEIIHFNRSTKFDVLSAWTQNGVDKIDIRKSIIRSTKFDVSK